ncbi:MAG: OmpH family outer membrane protein [Bacteroidales bacterium]|nr:OmpH family outer membrane protein [Bacteroidales bacterium]
MKKTPLILSIIALAGVIALAVITFAAHPSCKKAVSGTENAPAAGTIVYFNLDRVIAEYDMANDLRSVVETKVESINQEVNRRGNKLDSDAKSFQDKMDKGLLTRSVAEAQYQKLQEQQVEFQNYAAQKQQEIAEEESVMMNQLADAIKTFVDAFNAEKQYALILTTQGDVLPAPVVAGDEALDITDVILEGLNAEYVKSKK